MRASLLVQKNEHGVYFVRKKVPERLQRAVAEVLNTGKSKQTFLQRSLRTKSLQRAKVTAKPVLIEFDDILARAEALIEARPVQTTLAPSEIERIAEYHYARVLAGHDEFVRNAPETEREWRKLEQDDGPTIDLPEYGLSGGQMLDAEDNLPTIIREAESAAARGDLNHVSHHLQSLLAVFRIALDAKSPAFRDLGMAVLRSNVRAVRAILQRTHGEPIETPALPDVEGAVATGGETLRQAFEGWRKARNPAAGTLSEYQRAIDLFIELHANLPVVQLRKSHARTFREALQDMPRQRSGTLARASFKEQSEWGKLHPKAKKISTGTVNKLLGGVQAIALWARDNGSIPDNAPWADPFANMRLDEERSEREPFTTADLNKLFAAPVFTSGDRPQGGKGEAAFWLPLLGLFTGARRGELAALTAADVSQWEDSGTWALAFVEDKELRKGLKTKGSARIVPVHPELVRLGWLDYTQGITGAKGKGAWLFPELSPDNGDAGPKAWTKWFTRYLRTQGIADTNKVFHSFRHGFKDALRAAQVPEDLNDALTGHSAGTVGRSYGAKEAVRRFGIQTLAKAVAKAKYKGLDLSRVKPKLK